MGKKRKIYTVQEAKKMTEKDLRRQYSKMAYEARKRIAEVSKKGGMLYGTDEFNRLSELSGITKAELAKKVAFASRFLSGNTTVSKYQKARKKEITTLHESGFDFVDKSNIEQFRQYMKELRNAGALDGTYDSDAIAESFEDVERKGLDIEQIAENFVDFGDRYSTWSDFAEQWL